MYFYHVLARLNSYHGTDYLTYSSERRLIPGSIVTISVRKKTTLGIVIRTVSRPSFATKPINNPATDLILPSANMKLLYWLIDYYPSPLGTVAQQFIPTAVAQTSINPPQPVNHRSYSSKQSPPLTIEQAAVLENIDNSSQPTFVLHGDTGTGKTRIYIELAKKTLATESSVLILTPEIGLTPQLVSDFETTFNKTNVVLLHSTLAPNKRRKAWLDILQSSKPIVIVGPRSALFSPIAKLGLIVVDEFHEAAYKQEQAPHYQAVRVASQLARIHDAKLILGSATPSTQDHYFAQAKGIPILRMKAVASQTVPAERSIEIIDMRDKRNHGHNHYLSTPLLKAIALALQNKDQVLIFLNRRGTARIILCQGCGWQAMCQNCAIALTYHGDSHLLKCHTCGYSQSAPLSCPICHNTEIVFKSMGTKSLVEALVREFPKARIQRFDTDSKRSERIEQHYEGMVSGEIEILVGTQMLTKGLDLPKLSLVGIVAADTSLYFPDYTAEEHTYQLLSQVVGRVGRGHRKGLAVIQTYTPDNPSLQAVIKKDWDSFYKTQLEQRQQFLYPPFCFILKLSCARSSAKSAKTAAERLVTSLREQSLRCVVVGPSPSYYEKVAGKYRWQVIIKAKGRGVLLKIIKDLPSGWNHDIDPVNLL